MRASFRRAPAGLPLHVTLSVVFTTLLVLVGAALILFNFTRASKLAVAEADDDLANIAAHLEVSVSELYGPAQNLVDLGSKMRLSSDDSVDERQHELDALTEALRLRPEIESVFVGNDDGSFSSVRSLQGRTLVRTVMDAPDGARFARQRIYTRADSKMIEEVSFFGNDDRVVARRTTPWTGFDPRDREWYRAAMLRDGQVVTAPYIFFTTREVGVTIARRLAGGDGVIGADISLAGLSDGLIEHTVTPSSRLILLGSSGRVLASSDPRFAPKLKAVSGTERVELPSLLDLEDEVYTALARDAGSFGKQGKREFRVDGRTWLAWISPLPVRAGGSISLITLLPRSELLVEARRTRDQSLVISVVMLVFTVGLSVLISRHISGSLRKLAHEAGHIRELRFETPITVHSRIREVADLAATMAGMKASIQQFLNISHALSAERDHDRLLEMILEEARSVCRADAGAIFLRTEDWRHLEVSILHNVAVGERYGGRDRADPPFDPIPIATGEAAGRHDSTDRSIEARTVDEGVIRVDDLRTLEGPGALEFVSVHFDRDQAPARSLLSAPLLTSQGEVIGVLQLVNARNRDGTLHSFSDETIPYIEALCSDAAVALDNRRLLKAHKDLLESFIHVLAGAIDAKSHYTHGHCQRVPEIARMIAHAAQEEDRGAFADFNLSDDEWYELHLASWLHDCGKVTTPEYVVDKATKLETLVNRIHEIRTRFEVLWRDAEIEYLKSETDGHRSDQGKERLRQRRAQLRDDFEFIAQCNLGDTPLGPDEQARIDAIGSHTWLRHFDDTLGLSHLEKRLRNIDGGEDLPAIEVLIADKPEHIIPREEGQHPFGDEPHDFKMEIPRHLYNRGERHNLKIARGTLTEEERFKINEHIVQTLRMLKQLPFPRELRRVPRWAGSHHEKLDGTGYPCRLRGDDLSAPERIMAVADVFEALTAADRPYMTPRSLSAAITIMRSMAASGHLCPDVFALFLRSGVYRVYGERYLQPHQIDDVDVDVMVEDLS